MAQPYANKSRKRVRERPGKVIAVLQKYVERNSEMGGVCGDRPQDVLEMLMGGDLQEQGLSGLEVAESLTRELLAGEDSGAGEGAGGCRKEDGVLVSIETCGASGSRAVCVEEGR